MKIGWNSHGEILMWKKGPFITVCRGIFSHLGCIWAARVTSCQKQRSFVLRILVNGFYVKTGEISDVTVRFYRLGGFHFKVVQLESETTSMALVGGDFYRQSGKLERNLAAVWHGVNIVPLLFLLKEECRWTGSLFKCVALLHWPSVFSRILRFYIEVEFTAK